MSVDEAEIMKRVHDAMEATTRYIEEQFNERLDNQQRQIDGLLEIIETLV